MLSALSVPWSQRETKGEIQQLHSQAGAAMLGQGQNLGEKPLCCSIRTVARILTAASVFPSPAFLIVPYFRGSQSPGSKAWWFRGGAHVIINRNKVHSKCNALESSPNHPLMGSWKNYFHESHPWCQKVWGTTVLFPFNLLIILPHAIAHLALWDFFKALRESFSFIHGHTCKPFKTLFFNNMINLKATSDAHKQKGWHHSTARPWPCSFIGDNSF